MCGICGIAGQGIISKDLDIFTDLLWTTGLRGHHSTGVFGYHPIRNKKQRFELTKRVQPSPSFVLQEAQTKIGFGCIESVNAKLYMGHCRWATVGDVNIRNAHPFDTGRYVSAHNGTLKDKKYVDKNKTDSQMMFEEMEKSTPKDVLDNLDFRSAFAISIFDKYTKTLTLATNGDRPLWMAVAKSRPVFYYASEKSALEFVSSRRGTEMVLIRCEPYKLHVIDTHSVEADTNETFCDIIDLQKPVPPVVTTSYGTRSSDGFDWSILEGDPLSSGLDSYCCACGTLLYGKDKAESQKYMFNGQTYYTCQPCLGFQNEVEEVKVG